LPSGESEQNFRFAKDGFYPGPRISLKASLQLENIRVHLSKIGVPFGWADF
jgi:hypothetical protein